MEEADDVVFKEEYARTAGWNIYRVDNDFIGYIEHSCMRLKESVVI